VATWVTRYRAEGEAGLHDRTSRPKSRPSQLYPKIIAEIESLRRDRKFSARRIHHHLLGLGYQLHLRTVGRWLRRLGISRLPDLTPDGANLRRPPQRIRAAWAGHMIHLDVKKLGKIPDGGGWWAHGRGSMAAKAAKRGPGARTGYTYLHSAVDGFSRLAYTEALDDEKAATTIAFFARARAFFAAHGITRIHRVITDNGANYRAKGFTRTVEALTNRHQRIRPYTPRHHGKGERYNRLLTDEVGTAARVGDSFLVMPPVRRSCSWWSRIRWASNVPGGAGVADGGRCARSR